MNNFFTSFKSIIYISFFLGIIILFFRYLFVPILIFIFTIKILSKFKINKSNQSKERKDRKNDNNKNRIIDGEFEDIE